MYTHAVSSGSSIGALQCIVLNNRQSAHKMTRALARRINYRLPEEELLSLADMALCEAARSFNPLKGAAFTTYLHYFIRGRLLALISEQKRRTDSTAKYLRERLTLNQELSESKLSEALEKKFLIEAMHSCLEELPRKEQEVIETVFLSENTVTEAAKRLGFSRGHVSRMKTASVAKLRKRLERRVSQMNARR